MMRLPPPCAGFDEDLSAFLDGALPLAREDEVRAHLDVCDACVRRLEAFALADAAVAATSARPATRPRVVTPRRRRWLGAAAGAVGALAAGLAALLLARPEGAERAPAPAPPATIAASEGRVAPPGASTRTPTPAPASSQDDPDDRLATATDDELELVDEIDTIEDLELIENLELVERLVARGPS